MDTYLYLHIFYIDMAIAINRVIKKFMRLLQIPRMYMLDTYHSKEQNRIMHSCTNIRNFSQTVTVDLRTDKLYFIDIDITFSST